MRKLIVPTDEGLPTWEPGSLRPVFAVAPPRLVEALSDAPTFFQLFCNYEGRPLRLDPWQVAFLRRRARFRAVEKSVQIGFSFLCAMEALHGAFLYEDETYAFISINESDAKEKVLYARKLYDGIEDEIRKLVPLSKDSAEELWFGPKERPSRLISLPATAGLRGRATNVYLDEIDHYRPGEDQKVFTAAMGRVTRGNRRLTIGSSVFGTDTTLSRIMQPESSPDFLKFKLPWWVSESPDVLAAIDIQRRNMEPEDFRQEYEAFRSDYGDSAFPQNLIRQSWHEDVNVEVERLDPDETLIAGFDPGGTRHPAVLTVLQQFGDRWKQVSILELRDERLSTQQERLDNLLKEFPGMSLGIDQLGVGKQMSEDLVGKWGRRVQAITFSEKSKGEMTLNLKKLMEDGNLTIQRDRQLAYQLNRTRRMAGGKVQQAGDYGKSHFDKYWALAMAASLITGSLGSVYASRGLVILGDDDDDENDSDNWILNSSPWRT